MRERRFEIGTWRKTCAKHTITAGCDPGGDGHPVGGLQHRRNAVAERGGTVHWRSAPASAPASAAASPVAAKDAKSAADMGGVDAVCAAGKAEGQVNIIATPPDWANYGQIITDFSAKYGIKVQSDKPDGEQPGRDQRGHAARRHRPPARHLRPRIVSSSPRHTDMFAPYKVADLGGHPRRRTRSRPGSGSTTTPASRSIGYDAKLGDIAKVADLADPKYKGKVALNGDPLKASAGFNGVVLAALANGGSADDIAPGVDFFKKLADSGNLMPVDPNPAHDRRRARPRS